MYTAQLKWPCFVPDYMRNKMQHVGAGVMDECAPNLAPGKAGHAVTIVGYGLDTTNEHTLLEGQKFMGKELGTGGLLSNQAWCKLQQYRNGECEGDQKRRLIFFTAIFILLEAGFVASFPRAIASVTKIMSSVTRIIGSVTGIIGSVTRIGGSVTGISGSVTGIIGSVTGIVNFVTEIILVWTLVHFNHILVFNCWSWLDIGHGN
ncbi:hypothetical protein TCAL_15691 [Tigriopus californicus]|uniref:Uncharacterized protein n=1 Tax=Tigriopus californicus TaxID=6832 RepID=A0A553P5N1_TIGCA|nr:hypothetical protein TCAL_15691 [Tigriopus californicus]